MISQHLTSISLDISCNEPVQVVKAKQLDNLTREITATFIDESGETFEIPSGATAEFRIQRPDGVLIVDTSHVTISWSSVTVTLTESMLEKPGRAIADIRIIQDAEVISARAFFIDIYQTANGTGYSGYSGTQANNTIMTQEQYESIENPSDNTVYYVRLNDGKIAMYLGSIRINTCDCSGSGGIVTSQVISVSNGSIPTLITGVIEEE